MHLSLISPSALDIFEASWNQFNNETADCEREEILYAWDEFKITVKENDELRPVYKLASKVAPDALNGDLIVNAMCIHDTMKAIIEMVQKNEGHQIVSMKAWTTFKSWETSLDKTYFFWDEIVNRAHALERLLLTNMPPADELRPIYELALEVFAKVPVYDEINRICKLVKVMSWMMVNAQECLKEAEDTFANLKKKSVEVHALYDEDSLFAFRRNDEWEKKVGEQLGLVVLELVQKKWPSKEDEARVQKLVEDVTVHYPHALSVQAVKRIVDRI